MKNDTKEQACIINLNSILQKKIIKKEQYNFDHQLLQFLNCCPVRELFKVFIINHGVPQVHFLDLFLSLMVFPNKLKVEGEIDIIEFADDTSLICQ